MRPGAVLGEVLDGGQAAQHPPALLLWVLEYAGRQRSHTDLAEIRPRAARALTSARRGQDLLDDLEFLLQDGQLAGHRGIQLDAERTCRGQRDVTSAGRSPETSCRKTRNRRSSLCRALLAGPPGRGTRCGAARPADPRRPGWPGLGDFCDRGQAVRAIRCGCQFVQSS